MTHRQVITLCRTARLDSLDQVQSCIKGVVDALSEEEGRVVSLTCFPQKLSENSYLSLLSIIGSIAIYRADSLFRGSFS